MVIYETNCHWEDCTKEYDTQEQLVHVSLPKLGQGPATAGSPARCRRQGAGTGLPDMLGHTLCKWGASLFICALPVSKRKLAKIHVA